MVNNSLNIYLKKGCIFAVLIKETIQTNCQDLILDSLILGRFFAKTFYGDTVSFL